jgi:hypothetical protein
MPYSKKQALLSIFIVFFLCACTPAKAQTLDSLPANPTILPTMVPVTTVAPTIEPSPTAPTEVRLWISPVAPKKLKQALVFSEKLRVVEKEADADIKLLPVVDGQDSMAKEDADWVYALAAPFPTMEDSVPFDGLKNAWAGKGTGSFDGKVILVSPETKAVFDALWGPSVGTAVTVLSDEKIEDTAWEQKSSWAIVPFEALNPRWKVIQIDGKSPLDRDFDNAKYPLVLLLAAQGDARVVDLFQSLTGNVLQTAGNRDSNQLTVINLTGTTALVRHTAQRMEEKGVLYPGEKIRSILKDADLTHISNEVPFYEQCPPANPVRVEMRFCSDPKYMELLQDIGTGVIELTGNHELDWGPDPFLYTLQQYQKVGLPYYGGGKDPGEGQKPFLFEHNGTKLALIGCNSMGPDADFSRSAQPGIPAYPGSLKCDMNWVKAKIQELNAQEYITIMTFQGYEMEDFKPQSGQRVDFKAASDAGATIVSGSQSHFPQTFAFNGERFIHYGLGNLFFDQMKDWNRQGFIDRHYFYAGRYISTQLVSVMLEDYAQPRPMTAGERTTLMKEIFKAGGW